MNPFDAFGMLRKQAWSKSIDNATRTHVATDCFGNELALFFDVYVVENGRSENSPPTSRRSQKTAPCSGASFRQRLGGW